MKKKDNLPLLSENEINTLIKDAEKREAPQKKKPIEKIVKPKTIEEKPIKPVKKEVKKIQNKIVKDIQNHEPQNEIKEIVKEKTPDIEYVLKSVTRYDLNWYYLKEKLMKFKKIILTPYKLYENWFNRNFNKSKIPLSMENYYKNLPQMEKQIHEDTNRMIAERTRKIIIKEVK
jgi:hypothetical protein